MCFEVDLTRETRCELSRNAEPSPDLAGGSAFLHAQGEQCEPKLMPGSFERVECRGQLATTALGHLYTDCLPGRLSACNKLGELDIRILVTQEHLAQTVIRLTELRHP